MSDVFKLKSQISVQTSHSFKNIEKKTMKFMIKHLSSDSLHVNEKEGFIGFKEKRNLHPQC